MLAILLQVYTGPGIESVSVKFRKDSDNSESDLTLGSSTVSGTFVSIVGKLHY